MTDLASLLRQRVQLVDDFVQRQAAAQAKIDDVRTKSVSQVNGIDDAMQTLAQGWRGPAAIRAQSSASSALAGLRYTASRIAEQLEDDRASDADSHRKQLAALDEQIAAARASQVTL